MTKTSPSTRTKNSWPISPSRASTLPSSNSRSSVSFASSTRSARERFVKSGARPSAVALSSCEKSCMCGIYRPGAPLPTASRSFLAARGPVAVPRLPVVAELRDRLLLPIWDEHRVVAEALRAPRPVGDPALEEPGAAALLAVGREGDELGDVAAAAPLAGHALELLEELRHVLLVGRVRSGVAGRADPGPAAQPVDLQPGVLTDRPAVGRVDRAPELGLAAGILVEPLAHLLGQLGRDRRLDLPPGQEHRELAGLVGVLGDEARLHK